MSLAEQLKVLQIPGHSVIQHVASESASLLFDIRTAASLDHENIQAIGLHGFEELLLIDPAFLRFEQLFNCGSLRFRRSLEETNIVKKTKLKIRDYLILLTPYLFLKSAQKTLEWLMRQYQCHIWDQNELVGCILPFHESPLFGRIIQLFGTETNNASLDWIDTLIPCQKKGTGFDTQSLIRHCIKNRKMLYFICKMTANAKEILKYNPKSGMKIVFSFHAKVLTTVVETVPVIGEDMLSFLLPFIHSGLTSHVKDFVCSTYMVICSLSSKIKLTKDVTKAMLTMVLRSTDDLWLTEGLTCFLNVIQFQNVRTLSPRIIKLFLSHISKKSIVLLETLEKEYDISVFIDLLIPPLCKYAVSISNTDMQERSVNILKYIIDNLKLSRIQISMICKNLLHKCVEHNSSIETLFQGVKELLSHLAKGHATIFDECISSVCEEFSLCDQKKNLSLLKEVVMHCLLSEKYSFYGDFELPLFLNLNHPETNVRIAAVELLFSTVKFEDILDKDFYTEAIIARLNDDNPDVIRSVLKYPRTLVKILPKNALYEIVMKLMQESEQYNINELIISVLQSFPEISFIQSNEFVYAILGQLMFAFSGKRNKKLAEALNTFEIKTDHVFLKGIAQALLQIPIKSLSKGLGSEEVVANTFKSLLMHVADVILEGGNIMDVIQDFWDYLQKLPISHHLHLSGLLLLTFLIEKSPMLHMEIMKLPFVRYVEQCTSWKKKSDANGIETHTQCEEQKKYIFGQYYSCLKSEGPCDTREVVGKALFLFFETVVQTFINNHENLEGSIFAKQKLFNTISVLAVNSNSLQASNYQLLLNLFLSKAFIGKQELLSFLCTLYIKLVGKSNMDDESFRVAVFSLHVTKSLLSNENQDIDKTDTIVYATHLALLSNPHRFIREIALDNINVLYGIISKSEVWSYMLKKATESANEIVLDQSSVKRCWHLYFAVKPQTPDNFDCLMHLSKKGASDSQKISVLPGVIKSIQNSPASLQVSLLESLELVDPKITLQHYIPLIRDTLHKKTKSEEDIKVIQFILKCFRADMFDSLKELFPLFIECLTNDISAIQTCSFQLITPLFYDILSVSYKYLLIQELFNLIISSHSLVLTTEIRVMIKSLSLDTGNVTSLLGQFCTTFDLTYKSATSVNNPIQFDLDEVDKKLPMWRSLDELLNVLNHKVVKNSEVFVPELFQILERSLKCNGVEYVKQQILQTLLLITRQNLSKLSEDQFRVELLIQCLQSSVDIHTSQQCLLILSNAARLFPTLVIHNIMHIFSFMGGTMIRIDNALSFEVIEKTIDAVIPILIIGKDEERSKKRSSSSSVTEVITFILQTFVDSMPHCPEHRRLHIIKYLVKLLQPTEHLHTVMILLLKKVALYHHKQVSEEEHMKLSPISLELCKDLYSSYPIPNQVYSLYKMIAYVNIVRDEKKTFHKSGDKLSNDLLFDVNVKQANLLKYYLMSFTLDILQHENFKSAYNVKPQQQQHLTSLYSQLIEELLSYADKLRKSIEVPTSKGHHFKSIQKKVSEVVGQLYDLLPIDFFITIVSKLILKEDELIRKKSLELLCRKLSSIDKLLDLHENSFVQLLNSLLTLIGHKEAPECASNKQLMLSAIKLISMKLCKSQQEHVLKAVPIVAQLYSNEHSNEKLSINAMLCVAELSSLLKVEVIPYLPVIMKPLFSKISTKDSVEYRKVDSMSKCITVLHTLLKSLPQFLSPYVSDYLLNIASYEIIAFNTSDTALMEKVVALKEDMGKVFPLRVLFPAIHSCFDSLLNTSKEKTISVIDVYRYSLQNISKADANTYSKDILCITKKIFDVQLVLSDDDDRLRNTLEELSIQAFNDLILKLTENTLRHMYLELLNWSMEKDDISHRLLSYYRLSLKLSESLKSLFLLFVGHVFKKSKDILTKLNLANGDSSGKPKFLKELGITLLDMLSNCFLYDSQGFTTKERFESILQPLVDQIDNKVHGDGYISFAKDHLSPCIVNLVVAVNDPTCWKQLNHQILLKTKSEDEHVRLISLYVTAEIYNRLGESYVIMIPDTIPFLAEILEDDSAEVEKQCQKVIHEIEEVSGESIQKYF